VNRKYIFLVLVAVDSLMLRAQYPVAGGSNYVSYAAEPPSDGGPGYSPITDFYLQYNGQAVSSIVDSQLATMAANGQQRISLPLIFIDGGSANGQCPYSGTPGPGYGALIDSSSGAIPPNCLSALISIIQDAYSHGLGVRLRFFPQGPNNPQKWTTGVDWTHAIQNLNFIYSVHDAMTSNGLYLDKYDLSNEMMVANFPYITQYTSWLWGQYTLKYGNSDTVGFSASCDNNCVANLSMMPQVYGTTFPPVFELHIYGNCLDPNQLNAHDAYLNGWNYLQQHGETQGWIIGETCYNDLNTSEQLYAAHETAGNVVFFLQQWPDVNPNDTQTYYAPPLLYSNYHAWGW
jgi:hypothetical protein